MSSNASGIIFYHPRQQFLLIINNIYSTPPTVSGTARATSGREEGLARFAFSSKTAIFVEQH